MHTAARLPEGMVAVRVPGVPSLHLEVRGPLPQTLIEAWQFLWQHPDRRSFTTDLEVHHQAGVDLYIAARPTYSEAG